MKIEYHFLTFLAVDREDTVVNAAKITNSDIRVVPLPDRRYYGEDALTQGVQPERLGLSSIEVQVGVQNAKFPDLHDFWKEEHKLASEQKIRP